MGCFDNEDGKALKASRELERRLAQDEAIEKRKMKLLLLGAGESGKSTIFKQMRVLYGAPLTDQEKKEVTPIVYVNTISSMKLLVNQTALWGYQDQVSFYIYYSLLKFFLYTASFFLTENSNIHYNYY